MSRPLLVLFDLDGTLVDSAPDIAYSVDQALQRVGLPPRGEAKVREWIGDGAERLVKRALLGRRDGEPDPELLERTYAHFNAIYEENIDKRSRLYPGAREALEALQRKDCVLGCVTNKPARFTNPLLETLGISSYFSIVLSGDSLPKKKPDPLPLLHAAERFGIEPKRGVMVGDSLNDLQAGRAAGFHVVCVDYGYSQGVDMSREAPDALIKSLHDLPPLLEGCCA